MPGRVVVNLRLKPETIARIDEAAVKTGRSRSDVLRRMLAAGLPTVEAEAERADEQTV